jgi:predicted protein tyrosine phosphatase
MPIEIIPHLWLGDYKDAEHVSYETKLIVNCTDNIPFFSCDASHIRIEVDDIPEDNHKLFKAWTETDVFESMLNHIMQGHDVLVHCQMGRQRSAATIAAFLMKLNCMSKRDAISLIKTKKREAFFPSINFDEALDLLENSLGKI